MSATLSGGTMQAICLSQNLQCDEVASGGCRHFRFTVDLSTGPCCDTMLDDAHVVLVPIENAISFMRCDSEGTFISLKSSENLPNGVWRLASCHKISERNISTMQSSSIQFNDMGIAYYKSGQMDLAVYAFTEALNQTRHTLASDEASKRATLSNRHAVSSTQETILQDNGKAADTQEYSSMDIWDTEWLPCRASFDDFFVFARVFQIPNDGKLSLAECGLRSMFNLALTHHRRGAQVDSLTNLEKAAKLYGLAYSLLTSEEAGCPIMLAAIVNNLGHVHRLLGHVEKAHRCFQHLLMALMYVTVGSSVRLKDDLQQRFFSNVMYMVLNDMRLAPAA
jgi:tetratricopeptide (TPR) repeat protein